MGTFIVCALIGAAVVAIIGKMVKDKKAGKSVHCGNDCKNCGGGCH